MSVLYPRTGLRLLYTWVTAPGEQVGQGPPCFRPRASLPAYQCVSRSESGLPPFNFSRNPPLESWGRGGKGRNRRFRLTMWRSPGDTTARLTQTSGRFLGCQPPHSRGGPRPILRAPQCAPLLGCPCSPSVGATTLRTISMLTECIATSRPLVFPPALFDPVFISFLSFCRASGGSWR